MHFESCLKFVGEITVPMSVDWVVCALPGVPCATFEQNKLFYFGSNIIFGVILSLGCGERYLKSILDIFYKYIDGIIIVSTIFKF